MKKRIAVFKAAAVAGILILLVFTAACSGDLLGYIKDMIAQGESIGIELPKTGQEDSHAPGDDGDLQTGVAWPVPRFTDNGNGTITDNLTGLMWEQALSDTQSTWTAALSYANGLSLGGHSDWRLPNVNELESLINAGQVEPDGWLNDEGFAAVQAQHYYSSTNWAPTTNDYVWIVSMDDGRVIGYPKNASYVLAVRSGQAAGTVSLPRTGQITSYATGDDGAKEMGVAWPDPRFTVGTGAETGCITDNLTGLMWEQAPSGTSDWEGALTYANDLDLGGHRDWRLPNRKELRSLINYGKEDTKVWLEEPEQGFSPDSVKTEYYWSSTTSAPDTTTNAAWGVRMYDGTVQPYLKMENHYVLAVRGGQ